MSRIVLPDKVNRMIDVIERAGYEAYAVGGCIRDSLLGREPDDWDVTTSARPEEIKRLFRRTVDTGLQHGTVTVLLDKEAFEVTTYRIDGEYEDGRHPREVTFTPCLEEDLRRRDFTINAMAFNESRGLADPFGGQEDLRRGIVRCVGDPGRRFGEDALRIMRAVRFSAQLSFSIEEGTAQAVRRLAPSLARISAERIQVELVKLLVSPHPDYLRDAWDMGITRVILPEFDRCMETEQNNPHHCYTVGEHILHTLEHVPPRRELRLTMLLHDIAKPLVRAAGEDGVDHFHGHAALGEKMAVEILRRLKFDNDTIGKVSGLVKYHDCPIEPTPAGVRRAMSAVGPELFPLLLDVKQADCLAQSESKRERKLSWLSAVRGIHEQIEADGDCVSLKTLAVTGRDLIAAGMSPGPQMGNVLNRLLDEVLEHPEKNTKEILLGKAAELRPDGRE